jgi:hypothetical protein
MSGDFADIGLLLSYYGYSNYSVFAQHERRLQERLSHLKSQQQTDFNAQQAPVDAITAALLAAQTRAQAPPSPQPSPGSPGGIEGSHENSTSGLPGLGELPLLPEEEAIYWELPRHYGVIVTIDAQDFKVSILCDMMIRDMYILIQSIPFSVPM